MGKWGERGRNRGGGGRGGGEEDRSSCLLEERTCRVGQLTLFYTDNIMYIFIYIIFFFSFPSLYILCTRSNAVGNQMCPTTFALQRYVLTMEYERKIVGNARAHLERRPIAGIV